MVEHPFLGHLGRDDQDVVHGWHLAVGVGEFYVEPSRHRAVEVVEGRRCACGDGEGVIGLVGPHSFHHVLCLGKEALC